MSLDYLEDLHDAIDSGREYFACQGQNTYQWHISTSFDELRSKAQRTANAKRYAVNVYRMSSGPTTTTGECFLVVKRIVPTAGHSEPHLDWVLVDTRQAAESVRDISFGPSPYFGLAIEDVVKPEKTPS